MKSWLKACLEATYFVFSLLCAIAVVLLGYQWLFDLMGSPFSQDFYASGYVSSSLMKYVFVMGFPLLLGISTYYFLRYARTKIYGRPSR